MKKKFQWGRRAPGFPATRLRKAVLMSAFMASGLVIMTCWGYAGESSVESRAVAADDTCNCKKNPQQSGDIGCDSIKVITFQGGPDCVFATTIYEDCELNSSGISDYLALGFWNGKERRLLLRFNLDGIVDEMCLNPALALVAQFDSVRVTLYTASCEYVDSCEDKTRQFFVGRLLQGWRTGNNGADTPACSVLNCGTPASQGSVRWCYPWTNQCGGYYIFSPNDVVPRNIPLSQTSPGSACIDSVMFVCHRPSPYNRYLKQTIGEWISDPDTNFGWVIMPDSTQRAIHPNSALVFHSSGASILALRPKLTMYFTPGVDRGDAPPCGTVRYIKLPSSPAATGRE